MRLLEQRVRALKSRPAGVGREGSGLAGRACGLGGLRGGLESELGPPGLGSLAQRDLAQVRVFGRRRQS
eukprot:432155-Alexandrium_andersonii.AAC.1